MAETVKLYLSDDYYEHEGWREASVWGASPDGIFDVPVEQRDRWQAAMDAYADMQGEIAGYLKARSQEQQAERAAQRQRQVERETLLVRPWRKGP